MAKLVLLRACCCNFVLFVEIHHNLGLTLQGFKIFKQILLNYYMSFK